MSVANDYKFSSPIVIGSGSIPRSHFVLHARSEEVGRLQIVDGVMCFTGNTDAAARVMLDYFLEQFNQQIKAYGQQCRDEAAKEFAAVASEHGLTLVTTATGYSLLKFSQITAGIGVLDDITTAT